MIRRAVERDIDAVERQYAEILDFEQEHGSRTNWKAGVYPTRAVAEQGVADGSLYVMEEDGSLCASMLLNHVQLDVYASIAWKYAAEPEKVLVIHTLCVPPSQAGKGIGSRMVRFALEEAARRAVRSYVSTPGNITSLPQTCTANWAFATPERLRVFWGGLPRP